MDKSNLYNFERKFYRKGAEGCNHYAGDPKVIRSQFVYPADDIKDDTFLL